MRPALDKTWQILHRVSTRLVKMFSLIYKTWIYDALISIPYDCHTTKKTDLSRTIVRNRHQSLINCSVEYIYHLNNIDAFISVRFKMDQLSFSWSRSRSTQSGTILLSEAPPMVVSFTNPLAADYHYTDGRTTLLALLRGSYGASFLLGCRWLGARTFGHTPHQFGSISTWV